MIVWCQGSEKSGCHENYQAAGDQQSVSALAVAIKCESDSQYNIFILGVERRKIIRELSTIRVFCILNNSPQPVKEHDRPDWSDD